MILYARTTVDDAAHGPSAARLDLTPERAARLLGYRPLLAPLVAHDGDFYGVEFLLPTGITWGKLNTLGAAPDLLDADDDLEEGKWFGAAAGAVEWRHEERVAAATLLVTATGVMWSAASPRHTDGTFETPELRWGFLERAAGADFSWVAVLEPLEDDEDDDEEEDD